MPRHRAHRRRLTLTRRGRLVRTAAVALVLVLVITTVLLLSRGRDETQEVGTASATPAPTTAVAVPAVDSAPPAPAPAPEIAAGGAAPGEMAHSGARGDGTWALAPASSAPIPPGPTARTYALKVEGGTGIDVDAAAQEVETILSDPRGWMGAEGVAFQRVADPAQADMTISLATPPTVDAMCRPADTEGTWNCRKGSDVVLNSDRWLFMTPTYDDLGAYHTYMLNHEVGHFLGHGHRSCEGPGRAAPVMLQQSMGLDGCRANPWPSADGQA